MGWDSRFLRLAELIAGWSKDPSTKVGAVIVSPERRVISLGFNGLPRGVEDLPSRLLDRDLKLRMVVHAERNALLFAQCPLYGCTIYTYPMPPCAACASMIIQSGIKRVVSTHGDFDRWATDHILAKSMYDEVGIAYDLMPLS